MKSFIIQALKNIFLKKIDAANNNEEIGPVLLIMWKKFFVVLVPIPKNFKKRFRFGYRFQRLVPVRFSVPTGRFRFGFRLQFSWNRCTLLRRHPPPETDWIMLKSVSTLARIIFYPTIWCHFIRHMMKKKSYVSSWKNILLLLWKSIVFEHN